MEHQRIVNMAAESGFSKIYLIGKNFAGTEIGDDRVSSFSTFEEFTTAFPKHHRDPGVTYLIKASRGMALERVLDYL
jgi:UDP-N-acetylmuramoyl-tripeptide--D-alanyl-D-alanine ligase